jgi:translation initiation factor 4A
MAEFYTFSKWDELDISTEILRGIYAKGYEHPSPIQQKAILPIIGKRDVIAQAQSGTGKTATFAISSLSLIDLHLHETQVLILSPTRELTIQTAKVIQDIGFSMEGLVVQTMFGGNGDSGFETWRRPVVPHIVCGCAGRVLDMIERGRLSTKYIKLLILDEADEMLSYGFKAQIYNIVRTLPEEVQIGLFSATLPAPILEIASKLMRDPITITVKAEMLTLEGIQQYFVPAENDEMKYQQMKNIFNIISVSQCIIYCNSIHRVETLYRYMQEDGYSVCFIHGQMERHQRIQSFNDFKSGKYRILISSDLTARGIDIQQVETVINFDLPRDIENYLHRIGRSGRWGRKGIAINIITRRDLFTMRQLEGHYACQINELKMS